MLDPYCGYNPSTEKDGGPRCEGPADHAGEHYYSEYNKLVYGVPTKADVDASAVRDAAPVPAKT